MRAANARQLPDQVAHLWDDVQGNATQRGLSERVNDLLRIVTVQTEAIAELRQEATAMRRELDTFHDRFGPAL